MALTLHSRLVTGIDTRIVLVLLIALARLLGVGGLLKIVDGFARAALRLLRDVGVVDGSLF